jgi:hypothetical protein
LPARGRLFGAVSEQRAQPLSQAFRDAFPDYQKEIKMAREDINRAIAGVADKAQVVVFRFKEHTGHKVWGEYEEISEFSGSLGSDKTDWWIDDAQTGMDVQSTQHTIQGCYDCDVEFRQDIWMP